MLSDVLRLEEIFAARVGDLECTEARTRIMEWILPLET